MRALQALTWTFVLLTGCLAGPVDDPAAAPTPAPLGGPLDVVSPAFEDGAEIPRAHTCDGEDASPPFAMTGAPLSAPVAALIVYDPDAPLPQLATRNITHWVAWNAPLASGTVSFPEGGVPPGTLQGANERGANEYAGPCPPQASPPHRYVFWAFALDAPLELAEGATRAELEDAMRGHVLAEGTLTGLYARALVPERAP